MAEKEERYISITQMVAKENIETEKYRVMPRQEAIRRMAKSLHKESTRISNMEKDFDKLPAGWRKSFYNYAEAALNALLNNEK